MSVFASLFLAHRLMERLIARLERSPRRGAPTAGKEARDTFLVLLPALERHEKIEDLVFGAAMPEEVALQHRKLDRLRAEIAQLIGGADGGDHARFAVLVPLLAAMLRRHFLLEERVLWPRYRARGRCLERSTERAARKQVRDLEREIEWGWRAVAGISGR